MSGYSDMLAQGKKFAEERKEKAQPKKSVVDSLAASLLGNLEQNIYQLNTPLASESASDSVESSATGSATDGATGGDQTKMIATDGATDGATGSATGGDHDGVSFKGKRRPERRSRRGTVSSKTTSIPSSESMDPAYWTDYERRVFEAFHQSQDHLFSYPALSTKLGISPATIRRIAERFEAAGFIRRRRLVTGRIRGVEIQVLRSPEPADSVTDSVVNSVKNGVTDSVQKCPYKEDIDKIDRSISIWDTSYEDMLAMWPHVCAIGFSTVHLRQLQQIFEIQRFEEATVALSLRYLDWQLEHSGGQLHNPKGEPVSDPIAYWLASMRRNGYYNKPKGYVDPLVEAKRLLLEQEREETELEKALQESRRQKERSALEKKWDILFAEISRQGEKHPHYGAFMAALPSVLRTQVQMGGFEKLSHPGAKAGVYMALKAMGLCPEEKK